MQPTPDPIIILAPRCTTWDGGIIQILLRVSLVLSSQDNSFHISTLLKLFHKNQPNFQSTYQHNFQPAYQHQEQNHQDRKITDLKRMIGNLSKTQASMMNNYNQAINRLEVQLANSLKERQREKIS